MLNLNEPVHKYLYAAGCKGRRKSSHTCPLAMFLRKTLRLAGFPDSGTEVAVGKTVIVVYYPGARAQMLTIPPELEDFVEAFDLGLYPELEAVPGNVVV